MRKNIRFVLAYLLIILITVFIMYILLFHLPSKSSLIRSFETNESHFYQTVEYLQSHLIFETDINKTDLSYLIISGSPKLYFILQI